MEGHMSLAAYVAEDGRVGHQRVGPVKACCPSYGYGSGWLGVVGVWVGAYPPRSREMRNGIEGFRGAGKKGNGITFEMKIKKIFNKN